MSRVGSQPVEVPSGVQIGIDGQKVEVRGPKGVLARELRPEIAVKLCGNLLHFEKRVQAKNSSAYHGMERVLVANMVRGVSQGYAKELELVGVGYRAELKGDSLNLALGFSHEVDFKLPPAVKGSVLREGRSVYIRLESIDKQLLGQVAASLRALRPPEPYKGKGVRYRGERVKTKAGKSGKK